MPPPRAIESLPSGVAKRVLVTGEEFDFKPWLLAVALALALIDLLVSLAYRGHLRRAPLHAHPAAWLLAAAACKKAPPPEPQAAYVDPRNCAACHGSLGQGGTGPALNDKGTAYQQPDRDLLVTIINGRKKPGAPEMPAWNSRLTTEDIENVLSFIKTWWTDDQRASQAALTARP